MWPLRPLDPSTSQNGMLSFFGHFPISTDPYTKNVRTTDIEIKCKCDHAFLTDATLRKHQSKDV